MLNRLLLLFSLLTTPAHAEVPFEPASMGYFDKAVFDASRLLTVSEIPRKKSGAVAPVILSKSALVMEVDTGTMLYKKNLYQRLPMASLTKIMTALLILESHDLDEVVLNEVDFSTYGFVGVKMWLHQYEKITVENLLVGLLVSSAGDAAVTLAIHHSGSVEAFVEQMNRRAAELNLSDTQFSNPIGLDEDHHYSTAFDLATLTRFALRNKDFRRLILIDKAVPKSVDGEIEHPMDSTNYLLNSYLDIRGVKTGTTEAAGQSLINLARLPGGREVITVLLDSPERFQESKRLIDWSFRNYIW